MGEQNRGLVFDGKAGFEVKQGGGGGAEAEVSKCVDSEVRQVGKADRVEYDA